MNLRYLVLPVLFAASLAGADQSLLNYVMPGAQMIAGIDVDRAKDSPLGRKLLEEMNSKESELTKFITATGFDPRRDLREVIIATTDTNARNRPSLMIARGTFDASKIKAFVATSGFATAEPVGGIDLFSPSGKDDVSFALLDANLAIAGDKKTVREALLRRNTKPAISAEDAARVQSMSQSNDIWLVSSIPVAELSKALPKGGPNGGGVMSGDAFKGIEQAALGLRFNADAMDITAETTSKDAKDATAIADVVRFLATMVQMNRDKAEMKGLATALDAMKLSADGRTTRLTITVPVEDVERMFNSGQRKPRRI